MRLFNSLKNLKETLENSEFVETNTGYDMSKEKKFLIAKISNDWENLPKGIFLIRNWKGSPKEYKGFFRGGNYLSPSTADKIIIYENNEIEFYINSNKIFSINYEDLHNGNDYDIIFKKIFY